MPVSIANESTNAVVGDAAIGPFRIDVTEEELDARRARCAGTRWPDKETVDDWSHGVQLVRLRPFIEYLGHWPFALALWRGER